MCKIDQVSENIFTLILPKLIEEKRGTQLCVNQIWFEILLNQSFNSVSFIYQNYFNDLFIMPVQCYGGVADENLFLFYCGPIVHQYFQKLSMCG